MIAGGFFKRAWQRAAKQSTTIAKNSRKCPLLLGSALQREGIVAVQSTSAWTMIAELAGWWVNEAFDNSSNVKEKQLLLIRSETRLSRKPNNSIACDVCSTSSRTADFKPSEKLVITIQGIDCRLSYSCRSLRGSLQRRQYFHTEGGAAAGLESSASCVDYRISAPAETINSRPSSEECSTRTTVASADDKAVANKCQEIPEESEEVVVDLHPTTTTTNQSRLGPFQLVDLPKIENPTAKVINRVCTILDLEEWGPDTLKNLEDANLVITPFLTRQIVQRMSSKNVDLTWNFFKWAREKAGGKTSVRAHIAILDALGLWREFGIMKEAFALVLKDGHRKSAWPYNNALKWCSTAKDVEAALYFWSKMKENKCKATVVTYTRLIDLVAKQGFHQESLEIFRQMLQANCPPNISTYNVLIHACGVAGQSAVAESLFDRLSELGCKPNYTTYKTLISMHVGAGQPERALKYVNRMKAAGMDVGDDVCRTLHSSSPKFQAVPEQIASEVPPTGRLISPDSLVKLLEKGEPLGVEAKLEKIKPLIHSRFVVRVLQRLKNPDTALIFFDWAKHQPHFEHTQYSYCKMINVLGRSRNNEALDRILKEMQELGIVMNASILTAVITCYGRANDMEGALKVFQQMKDWGFTPDIVTYTSVIHSLAKHGNYELAIDIFEEMKQAGIAPNVHTYSVMIYNLVKAGKVTEAVSLLKEMPGLGCQPNSITFATIIDHCAKDGQVEMARNLFSQMEVQGMKPLKATITVLETAFRRAGMTEDADKIIEKFRDRRLWDETFKSSTEMVAHELLFKDFAKSESLRKCHRNIHQAFGKFVLPALRFQFTDH